MHDGKRHQSAGFTLVEVLVVLAIVALVSAIAIPGLAKLGAFSRDEFKRTVVEVDSLLRAAQIYSTTYHVNTAVVYNMDNYSASEAAGGPSDYPVTPPIIDSLTGEPVRQIEAAAVMYQLPSTMGTVLSGLYVPIPDELGEFRPLPAGMSVMLQNPEAQDAFGYDAHYEDLTWANFNPASGTEIGNFGMNYVQAALGLPTAMRGGELMAYVASSPDFSAPLFLAHVFKPSGRLDVANNGFGRERFTMYIGPSADRPAEERVVAPESPGLFDGDGRSNLMYRRIYLYKSTARTSVPDAF